MAVERTKDDGITALIWFYPMGDKRSRTRLLSRTGSDPHWLAFKDKMMLPVDIGLGDEVEPDRNIVEQPSETRNH